MHSCVRRMHELPSRAKKGLDYLRLYKDFRADVEWWHTFLSYPLGMEFPCSAEFGQNPLMQMIRQVLWGVGHYGEACGCSFSGCQEAGWRWLLLAGIVWG